MRHMRTIRLVYSLVSLFVIVVVAIVTVSYLSVTPLTASFNKFQLVSRVQSGCLSVPDHRNRTLPRNNFLWNDTRLDILHMNKFEFSKRFRNPCWFEPLEEVNPYRQNEYGKSHKINLTFSSLSLVWRKRLRQHEHPCRLRCLPFFLVIGQPKCGSTDLFWKIAKHPHVTAPPIKELHWWSRSRQGRQWTYKKMSTIDDYIDTFDKPACLIENAEDLGYQIVTGEGSVSLFWDNSDWYRFPENYNASEPRYLNAHYIHHVIPDVKLILILRDPVERLYSDYLYFHKKDKSADLFHQAVVTAIDAYTACMETASARSCVYNTSLAHSVRTRLRAGLYAVYLRDWLSAFPREQFFIVRLEDYSPNTYSHLLDIYQFLGLDPLSSEDEKLMFTDAKLNERKSSDVKLGGMHEKTRRLLKEFYRPFNQDLAAILTDDRFLWEPQE